MTFAQMDPDFLLFSISGQQEPRLLLSGQTPGSVGKCHLFVSGAFGKQMLLVSGNAKATASDLAVCCLSPASSCESWKEKFCGEQTSFSPPPLSPDSSGN